MHEEHRKWKDMTEEERQEYDGYISPDDLEPFEFAEHAPCVGSAFFIEIGVEEVNGKPMVTGAQLRELKEEEEND